MYCPYIKRTSFRRMQCGTIWTRWVTTRGRGRPGQFTCGDRKLRTTTYYGPGLDRAQEAIILY
jgi:hypothetical protein